jgi:two-component system response regulator TctD
MMPALDGWGVLEHLRQAPSSPPVIVVSARSSSADVALARSLGAADYLVKPHDPEELLRRVATLLP